MESIPTLALEMLLQSSLLHLIVKAEARSAEYKFHLKSLWKLVVYSPYTKVTNIITNLTVEMRCHFMPLKFEIQAHDN